MTSLGSLRRAWVAVLLAVTFSASAEEIVTVSGRKGVTQSYLLMHNAPPPKAVAVMFPGSEGLLRLQGRNFLVRTRGMFRDAEVAGRWSRTLASCSRRTLTSARSRRA
jgi:hypothetical protein